MQAAQHACRVRLDISVLVGRCLRSPLGRMMLRSLTQACSSVCSTPISSSLHLMTCRRANSARLGHGRTSSGFRMQVEIRWCSHGALTAPLERSVRWALLPARTVRLANTAAVAGRHVKSVATQATALEAPTQFRARRGSVLTKERMDALAVRLGNTLCLVWRTAQIVMLAFGALVLRTRCLAVPAHGRTALVHRAEQPVKHVACQMLAYRLIGVGTVTVANFACPARLLRHRGTQARTCASLVRRRRRQSRLLLAACSYSLQSSCFALARPAKHAVQEWPAMRSPCRSRFCLQICSWS